MRPRAGHLLAVNSCMRTAILLVASSFITTACVLGRLQPRPFDGTLPSDTQVDLSGTFTFTEEGELLLELAASCTVERPSVPGVRMFPSERLVPCDGAHLAQVRVMATTPWHREVPGMWVDARHLVFRIDWSNSGLNPLEDSSAVAATRPWLISGTSWVPNATDVRRILQLIAEATGDTNDVVEGGAPPRLEVTRFEIDQGALLAGGTSVLTVEITNHGPGTAYRVVATTRSGIPHLHGQRLNFGMIRPGTTKVRHHLVALPSTESPPDTMLLLVLGEGNGFPPPNLSRRIPIRAVEPILEPTLEPILEPTLEVSCSIDDHHGTRLELDAGEDVILSCIVDNSGIHASNVALKTSLTDGSPMTWPAQAIPAGCQARYEILLAIPRGLGVGSMVTLEITARDLRSKSAARTVMTGVIRNRKLCIPGRLSGTQYDVKAAKLRAMRDAGGLTQAEFDRYDAELVSCLN